MYEVIVSGKNLIFKSKEIKERKAAADVIRQIANKLEAGELTLSQANEEVNLTIPNEIELEIEAKTKNKKNSVKKKLEIEIEWKEGETNQGPVKIN